jgi:hypothetical protein
MGLKSTGELVESVKCCVEDRARYMERCKVLEKRLAAIRATADGKADA